MYLIFGQISKFGLKHKFRTYCYITITSAKKYFSYLFKVPTAIFEVIKYASFEKNFIIARLRYITVYTVRFTSLDTMLFGESIFLYFSGSSLATDKPNRASESVVFNSDQKMALRAVYVVFC